MIASTSIANELSSRKVTVLIEDDDEGLKNAYGCTTVCQR